MTMPLQCTHRSDYQHVECSVKASARFQYANRATLGPPADRGQAIIGLNVPVRSPVARSMHDVLACAKRDHWRGKGSRLLPFLRLQGVLHGVAYTDPEVYVPTFLGSCFKAEVSMAQSSEV